MKRQAFLAISLLSTLALVACGGGGGTNAPIVPQAYLITVGIQQNGVTPQPYVGPVTAVIQTYPSTTSDPFEPTWFVVGQGTTLTTTSNSKGQATFTLPSAPTADEGVCIFVGTPLNPNVNPNSECGPAATMVQQTQSYGGFGMGYTP